jgi:hypothetical protein
MPVARLLLWFRMRANLEYPCGRSPDRYNGLIPEPVEFIKTGDGANWREVEALAVPAQP